MGKISEALTHAITIRESADNGSDFTNPAADYRRLFLGEDGKLHLKDEAGAVTEVGGGGGSAIVYHTAIPIMTSATAPSGTASESEHIQGGGEAWYAMTGSQSGWLSNGSALPQYIQYQFASPVTAIAYGLRPWYSDNYPARTPTAWTFKGSTDGTNWDTLDTVTGWAPIGSSVTSQWTIDSPASYDYYRLTLTANGGDSYTGVGRFLIYVSGGDQGLWTSLDGGFAVAT